MGNWEKQQEAKKEVKERDKTLRDKMAGYFLDLSKIVFTTIVLGGIIPVFSDNNHPINWIIMLGGAFVSILSAIIGYRILKYRR